MMPKKSAEDGTDEGFGFEGYLSPFTWRYGSKEMRSIFSEKRKRAAWREVWLALAEAQAEQGLLTKREMDDIRKHSGPEHVDIRKAHELEREIRHDLMAELRTFADQAKVGGGKLHLGATSMDIEDNADVLLYGEALRLRAFRILSCLDALRERISEHRSTVCMAWTHLQPAEPTTLGYRFANYAQDMVLDYRFLEEVMKKFLLGKGVKGAVGTSAGYKALLGSDDRVDKLEKRVLEKLGIGAFEVAGQTYPRKVDFIVSACLASIAQSCHKFGFDLRVMQSPAFGEMSEPIGAKQVGSSAMPFKRNPVSAERMCSLSRLAAAMPSVSFANAANSLLERTLDDSAGRRVAVPEAFLAIDECLLIYERLVRGLVVYPAMIEKNLQKFGPFAGTEALMMKLVELGGDRQKIHEEIREKSFVAWAHVMKGQPNPILGMLEKDRSVASKVSGKELRKLMDPRAHTGNATRRCDEFVSDILGPILKGFSPARGNQSQGF